MEVVCPLGGALGLTGIVRSVSDQDCQAEDGTEMRKRRSRTRVE